MQQQITVATLTVADNRSAIRILDNFFIHSKYTIRGP